MKTLTFSLDPIVVFKGRWAENQAESLLRNQQPGSYLIRHNPKQGFIFSAIDANGAIIHTKINSAGIFARKKQEAQDQTIKPAPSTQVPPRKA